MLTSKTFFGTGSLLLAVTAAAAIWLVATLSKSGSRHEDTLRPLR